MSIKIFVFITVIITSSCTSNEEKTYQGSESQYDLDSREGKSFQTTNILQTSPIVKRPSVEVWKFSGNHEIDDIALNLSDTFFFSTNNFFKRNMSPSYAVAINSTAGKVFYKYPIEKAYINSVLIPTDQELYFATQSPRSVPWDSAKIICLKKSSGEIKWEIPAASLISGLTIYYHYLYYTTLEGELTCLNRHNGKLIWSKKSSFTNTSSPYVSNDTLFVGIPEMSVFAINAATGEFLWEHKANYFVDVETIADSQKVYFTSANNTVTALSRQNGSLIWEMKTIGMTEFKMVLFNQNLFVTDDSSYIYSVDKTTGKITWQKHLEGTGSVSAPIIIDKVLYVQTSGGKVYALKTDTGDLIWSIDINCRYAFTPLVSNQILYTLINDSTLVALK